MKTILIVDDENDILEIIAEYANKKDILLYLQGTEKVR